jgi:hypothetical protein
MLRVGRVVWIGHPTIRSAVGIFKPSWWPGPAPPVDLTWTLHGQNNLSGRRSGVPAYPPSKIAGENGSSIGNSFVGAMVGGMAVAVGYLTVHGIFSWITGRPIGVWKEYKEA